MNEARGDDVDHIHEHSPVKALGNVVELSSEHSLEALVIARKGSELGHVSALRSKSLILGHGRIDIHFGFAVGTWRLAGHLEQHAQILRASGALIPVDRLRDKSVVVAMRSGSQYGTGQAKNLRSGVRGSGHRQPV